MLTSALDELARLRLEWPEALMIDLLADCYAIASRAEQCCVLARLHAGFLRELVEGEPGRAAALRLDIIATCAAQQIDVDVIEDADRAALRELRLITRMRFRNSPRLLAAFDERLDAATNRLVPRVPPPSPTQYMTRAVDRRSLLRLSPAAA